MHVCVTHGWRLDLVIKTSQDASLAMPGGSPFYTNSCNSWVGVEEHTEVHVVSLVQQTHLKAHCTPVLVCSVDYMQQRSLASNET